jgi:hypothetical protein
MSFLRDFTAQYGLSAYFGYIGLSIRRCLFAAFFTSINHIFPLKNIQITLTRLIKAKAVLKDVEIVAYLDKIKLRF